MKHTTNLPRLPRLLQLALALLLGAALATSAQAQTQAQYPAHYADQKAAYQNDGGGPDNAAYFHKMLVNIRNHVAAVGQGHIDLRVVDHGDGIIMLQMAKTDPALAQLIDAAKATGVHFLVCKNTLKERNIDWHTLYNVTEADLVPSGVAELVRLQQKGFSYIHP